MEIHSLRIYSKINIGKLQWTLDELDCVVPIQKLKEGSSPPRFILSGGISGVSKPPLGDRLGVSSRTCSRAELE
ncbi:hypothetical protein G6F70_001316 [Rhizopus microsporus]|nr:hypothetical protein G6F71_001432 [Rhizopus microsporus]KAG1203523.1 hypothetical protein G6F70_001316 [Rhizopus microsporus]KAG1215155.1 hypothetical protein G6F69_001279 [Rhizopus microsporus]KAG1236548.1 hypothetical protein G6F67_001918 [Rhizopus microsporus]KAG1268138.1 hypothetical protein G6F68_001362 [Rhizopus microsporus]